jgi:UDP-3-O-[3-hydroxymyristoyl] N-acetylglucosamine deacetylase
MMTFSGGRQTTIDCDVVLSGIGVHSGTPSSVILHPAEANTGWVFVINSGKGRPVRIPADFRVVKDVRLCTVLGDESGATISTVEHLLAALRGMSVDNCEIEIDNNEMPVMDGSAAPFVEAIDEAGLRILDEARRYIKVLKPIRLEKNNASAELLPYHGNRFDITIDFPSRFVGRQELSIDLTPDVFRREISRARTFGFMKDVKALWAAGRALGSSLENTIAISEDRILNPEGLRFTNEFVRHKTLDAVGDMALAGAPILGAYRSVCSGHWLNTAVIKALYEDRSAWTVVEADVPYRRRRRVVGHADVGARFQPVFAADRN